MVSKFKAFLLAGAVALPLVGTAALAQTTQPATPNQTVGGQGAASAQVTTPSTPSVTTPSVTAPSIATPAAPATPQAGVTTKSESKADAKLEHKGASGEHKGTAMHRTHNEKSGEKSSLNGSEAKKNQAAAAGTKANGSASTGTNAAVDPAKKL